MSTGTKRPVGAAPVFYVRLLDPRHSANDPALVVYDAKALPTSAALGLIRIGRAVDGSGAPDGEAVHQRFGDWYSPSDGRIPLNFLVGQRDDTYSVFFNVAGPIRSRQDYMAAAGFLLNQRDIEALGNPGFQLQPDVPRFITLLPPWLKKAQAIQDQTHPGTWRCPGVLTREARGEAQVPRTRLDDTAVALRARAYPGTDVRAGVDGHFCSRPQKESEIVPRFLTLRNPRVDAPGSHCPPGQYIHPFTEVAELLPLSTWEHSEFECKDEQPRITINPQITVKPIEDDVPFCPFWWIWPVPMPAPLAEAVPEPDEDMTEEGGTSGTYGSQGPSKRPVRRPGSGAGAGPSSSGKRPAKRPSQYPRRTSPAPSEADTDRQSTPSPPPARIQRIGDDESDEAAAAAAAEARHLRAENDNLRDRVARAEARVAALEEEIRKLQAGEDELRRGHRERLADLQAQVALERQRADGAERELRYLRNQQGGGAGGGNGPNERIAQLEEAIEQMRVTQNNNLRAHQAQVLALEDRNDALEAEARRLRGRAQEGTEAARRAEELAERLRRAEQLAGAAEARMDASRRRLAGLGGGGGSGAEAASPGGVTLGPLGRIVGRLLGRPQGGTGAAAAPPGSLEQEVERTERLVAGLQDMVRAAEVAGREDGGGKELALLETTLATAEANLEEAEAEVTALQRETQRQAADLADHRARLARAQADAAVATANLEAAQAENERLQRDLRAAERQAGSSIQHEELRRRLSDLEAERDRLSRTLEQERAYRDGAVERMKQEAEQRRLELEQSKARIAKLEDQTNQLARALNKMLAERQELEGRLTSLEAERNRLVRESAARAAAARQEAQQQLEQLEAERSRLAQALAAGGAQPARIAQLEAELAEAKRLLLPTREALQRQLDETEQKMKNECARRVQQVEEAMAGLRSEAERAQAAQAAQAAELERARAACAAELERARQAGAAEVERARAERAAELEQARARAGELRETMNRIARAAGIQGAFNENDIVIRLGDRQNCLDALRRIANLVGLQPEDQNIEATVRNLMNEAAQLNRRIRDLEAEMQNRRGEADRLNQTIRDLEAQLRAAGNCLESLEQIRQLIGADRPENVLARLRDEMNRLNRLTRDLQNCHEAGRQLLTAAGIPPDTPVDRAAVLLQELRNQAQRPPPDPDAGAVPPGGGGDGGDGGDDAGGGGGGGDRPDDNERAKLADIGRYLKVPQGADLVAHARRVNHLLHVMSTILQSRSWGQMPDELKGLIDHQWTFATEAEAQIDRIEKEAAAAQKKGEAAIAEAKKEIQAARQEAKEAHKEARQAWQQARSPVNVTNNVPNGFNAAVLRPLEDRISLLANQELPLERQRTALAEQALADCRRQMQAAQAAQAAPVAAAPVDMSGPLQDLRQTVASLRADIDALRPHPPSAELQGLRAQVEELARALAVLRAGPVPAPAQAPLDDLVRTLGEMRAELAEMRKATGAAAAAAVRPEPPVPVPPPPRPPAPLQPVAAKRPPARWVAPTLDVRLGPGAPARRFRDVAFESDGVDHVILFAPGLRGRRARVGGAGGGAQSGVPVVEVEE